METTSIWHNQLRDATGERVLKEGMPRLLEIYQQFGIKCTFFFTGYIAQKFPETVRMVLPDGHEVGCHGFTHEVEQAFDGLNLNQQITELERSKKLLEDISGQSVVSFRAPALRVNNFTPVALQKTGFLIDSSLAPQRFDMFLSFGSVRKMKWLKAPRVPYKTTQDDLFRRGNGPIVEIPISALLIPYIGTTLRISPILTKFVRIFLNIENGRNGKPIVFLFHPNEVIVESNETREYSRRSGNILSYLLADKLRRKLKEKNLGMKALSLLQDELEFFIRKGYRFTTVKQYCLENKLI